MAVKVEVVEQLTRLARAGVPLTKACSHVGISRIAAYRCTKGRQELRIVRPRLSDEQKKQLDKLIFEAKCSYSAIARRVGCSKSTVLRRRDALAAADEGEGGPQLFCRCRKTYRCPDCGGKVQARPCPACEVRKCHRGG